MTNRRSNRALSSTRRWTAGILLASALVTGGVGVHLAEAYATQSGPATTATSATTTSSSNPHSSATFGNSGAVSSSSNTASTTTKGS